MSNNKKKTLTDWDWTVLPAALRYYEHGANIASCSFPADVVERFFRGDYDEESCHRIAYQFAINDHGRRGKADWDNAMSMDREPWVMFYSFCKAYIEGFYTIYAKNDYGKIIQHEAFKNEDTGRWIPVDGYLKNPSWGTWIPDEYIMKVEKEEKRPNEI